MSSLFQTNFILQNEDHGTVHQLTHHPHENFNVAWKHGTVRRQLNTIPEWSDHICIADNCIGWGKMITFVTCSMGLEDIKVLNRWGQ